MKELFKNHFPLPLKKLNKFNRPIEFSKDLRIVFNERLLTPYQFSALVVHCLDILFELSTTETNTWPMICEFKFEKFNNLFWMNSKVKYRQEFQLISQQTLLNVVAKPVELRDVSADITTFYPLLTDYTTISTLIDNTHFTGAKILPSDTLIKLQIKKIYAKRQKREPGEGFALFPKKIQSRLLEFIKSKVSSQKERKKLVNGLISFLVYTLCRDSATNYPFFNTTMSFKESEFLMLLDYHRKHLTKKEKKKLIDFLVNILLDLEWVKSVQPDQDSITLVLNETQFGQIKNIQISGGSNPKSDSDSTIITRNHFSKTINLLNQVDWVPGPIDFEKDFSFEQTKLIREIFGEFRKEIIEYSIAINTIFIENLGPENLVFSQWFYESQRSNAESKWFTGGRKLRFKENYVATEYSNDDIRFRLEQKGACFVQLPKQDKEKYWEKLGDNFKNSQIFNLDFNSSHAFIALSLTQPEMDIDFVSLWDELVDKSKQFRSSGLNRADIKLHYLACLNSRPLYSNEQVKTCSFEYKSQFKKFLYEDQEYLPFFVNAYKKISKSSSSFGITPVIDLEKHLISVEKKRKVKPSIFLSNIEAFLLLNLVLDFFERGFIILSLEKDGLFLMKTKTTEKKLNIDEISTFSRFNSAQTLLFGPNKKMPMKLKQIC